MMQSIVLASVFLLIFTIQQGSSLQCYKCNSHKDKDCDLDKPLSRYLTNCTVDSKQKTGIVYCRKITQIIEFSVNNLPPDSRIIRSCGFQNQTKYNYCYQRAGFGGRQIVCSCDQDSCNSAGLLQNSFYVIASVLTAIFLLNQV